MSSKKQSLNSPQKSEARSDFVQTNLQSGSTHEVELDSNETVYYVQQSMNLVILLCCEDALFLYSFESVIKVPLVTALLFQHFHIFICQ